MDKLKKIFYSLRKIFPGYLLVLAFTPIITGYLINPSLVDARQILIQLIWISVFTIPAVLLNKKFFFSIIYTLFFIAGFIETAHWIVIKGPLTLTSILVISNTNLQESLEFFDLKTPYGLLFLIPYVLIYIIALKEKRKPDKITSIDKYVFSITFLISIIFIGENAINQRLIRKGVPQIVKTTASFITKIKLYNEAKKQVNPKNVNAVFNCKTDKLTIVIFLGESANRNHFSIYGYSRETTPKLKKRDDIIIFNDVVSPYSNTLSSVLTVLSESNLENKTDINKSIDIIDVLHSAGFKTYWISNQSPIGIWDNMVTVFANKSDKKVFVNLSGNSSFETINTASHDIKLLNPFKKALQDTCSKKFIIVHFMGSHAKYSKRYPKKFDIFKGNDKKEKTIAEYDNTIYYTDFILDSLFNILNIYSLKTDIPSAAIYFSDHGENVYDSGNNVGHDYSGTLPKPNVEIPFIVWLSDNYKNINGNKTDLILKNKSKPFVTDDLFHAIIDLSCVKTPYFEEKRSIFAKNFNSKRKRILEDGKDYDLK